MANVGYITKLEKQNPLAGTVSLVEEQTVGGFWSTSRQWLTECKAWNHLLLKLQVQEIFHSRILIVSTTFVRYCRWNSNPGDTPHSWVHIKSNTIVDLLLTMWVNRLDISFQMMRVSVHAAPWFFDFCYNLCCCTILNFNEEPRVAVLCLFC